VRFFAWYFNELPISNDIHTPNLITLIDKEAGKLKPHLLRRCCLLSRFSAPLVDGTSGD